MAFILPKLTEVLIKHRSAILIIIIVVIVVVVIIGVVVVVVIVVVDVDENISQGVSTDEHHADVADGGHGAAMLHRPGEGRRGVVGRSQHCHHCHHCQHSALSALTVSFQDRGDDTSYTPGRVTVHSHSLGQLRRGARNN